MKIITSIIVALFLTISIFAQTPEKMSYQAVIRNSSDVLLTNTQIGMEINILQGSALGTVIYTEIQTPTSNANGLVSIEIGDGAGFNLIDWANDSYFIETKIDLTGGINYTITGVSQLLSVPYALHAKTATSLSGGFTETDPVFGASVASNITSTDTTYWNNKLDSYTETDPIFNASVSSSITGTDTTYWSNKLDNYTETDPIFNSSVASEIIGTDTTNWNNKLDSFIETDPSIPTGTVQGEMQYWNGTSWVTVAPGTHGQGLNFCNGVPTWGPCLIPGTNAYPVTNPVTGRTWMDRNLGATQVATSIADTAAYGYLYQWGRGTDGHQIRTSGTTTILSSTDSPGHDNFITVGPWPYDWRSTANDNLWQGTSGINNPCPTGYRLPTITELNTEQLSWNSNNSTGAFTSPLKLPTAGYRNGNSGVLCCEGDYSYYWSSTPNGVVSDALLIFFGNSYPGYQSRDNGYSVRCIMD